MKEKINNTSIKIQRLWNVVLLGTFIALAVLAFQQGYVTTKFGELPVWQVLGAIAMYRAIEQIYQMQK